MARDLIDHHRIRGVPKPEGLANLEEVAATFELYGGKWLVLLGQTTRYATERSWLGPPGHPKRGNERSKAHERRPRWLAKRLAA